MKAAAWFAVLVVAGICSAGIKPRASSSDYRHHETLKGTTLAAEVVPARQVQSTFATDLTQDYVVLEVALYPTVDGPLNVSTGDFLLHCGNEIVRPGTPNAIAERRHHQSAPRRSDVDIYPTVGIGYESGNDPVTGRRRGIYTTTGVGVATGGATNPRPASTDQDRSTMALELEEKQLPAGSASQPVAGYLYFAFPASKQKKVAYELEYDGPTGRVRMFVK